MIIESVWVTTGDHLKRFSKVAKPTGLVKKIFSGFKIPDDFPRVKVNERVVPLIYTSQGSLQISGNEVAYTAEPPVPWPGAVFLDTLDNERFKVEKDQVIEIKRSVFAIGLKPHSINWIGLHYREGGKIKEVLLCAGNRGLLIKNINNDTDKLFKQLVKFIKD